MTDKRNKIIVIIIISTIISIYGLYKAYADEVCDIANNCYDRDGIKKYALIKLKSLISGEDALIGVLKTESRFVNIPVGGTTAAITADQLYKSGPGFVDGITCFSSGTAVAGTIILYDNTVGGVGDILFNFPVQAVNYSTPFDVPLKVPFSVGAYLDFTGATNMVCMLRYR